MADQGSATTSNQAFDQRLESLRGIAALAVVITHSIAVLQIDGSTAFWKLPLREHTVSTFVLNLTSAFFNAGSAVVLFFVLSGFVLTLSVQRLPPSHRWTSYAIRRAARLFPPMWVSILVAWVALTLLPPQLQENSSDWFRACFVALNAKLVLSNFILLDFTANPGTWTMYVESIGSLTIPLMVLATTRLSYRHQCGLFVLLAALTALTPRSLTVDYLVCFYAGVMIASNPNVRLIKLPLLSVTMGLAVFVLQRLLINSNSASILVNTLGSIAVIQGTRAGALDQLLESRPLRALGRCSYSLYLSHLVVLYFVGRFVAVRLDDSLSSTAIVVVMSVPIALIVAQFGYHWIEKPSISLGRNLSKWLTEPSKPATHSQLDQSSNETQPNRRAA